MASFRFTLTPGQPIFDQVVFTATKAFVSGEMPPGHPFPSVRALAGELKINAKTAAKVVQHLIQEGWLEATPGKGTIVASPPKVRAVERRRVLEQEFEQLAVESMRVGLSLAEATDALASHWRRLEEAGNTDAA